MSGVRKIGFSCHDAIGFSCYPSPVAYELSADSCYCENTLDHTELFPASMEDRKPCGGAA